MADDVDCKQKIMDITVKKRDGTTEKLDLTKINKMVEWACEDLKDVEPSTIEINAKLSFKNNITTKEIHDCLIDSAVNLISETKPDYQVVASRLLNTKIRKDVWGGKNPPKLIDLIRRNIDNNVYTPTFLEKYSEKEINKIDEFINHDRDYNFVYAGLQQLVDKYLAKNKITGELFETPSFAYALMGMRLFQNYEGAKRLKYIKKFFDFNTKHKVSSPTPLQANCRGLTNSYSSCCLIDTADTKESLYAMLTSVGMATCNSYGIGVNMSRIRSIGSSVRNGTIPHLGIIPWTKCIESNVKAASQGTRGGGGTITCHFFHYEIEDFIQLKNNGGTDSNRVRQLDYVVASSKLFFERFLKNENITLFDPNETQDLYDAFGTTEFDDLYVKYEKKKGIKKKVITASSLMSLFVKERIETGRLYMLFVDHATSHSSWDGVVNFTNLCVEVLHLLQPMQNVDGSDGLIGVCVLSALNVFNLTSDEEIEEACDLLVRGLDELIDVQDYFNESAKNFAQKNRSIGIGVTNYAAWLAKNNSSFVEDSARQLTHDLFEKIQFNLIKASVNLAKEKGKCEFFNKTKYSKGILPIDTYKKDVDSVYPNKLNLDWEGLRNEILTHGMRNNTLSCLMPCDSSSIIQCSTNGVEPPMEPLVYKSSKSNRLPVLVPNIAKWKNRYTYAFTFDNRHIIELYSLMIKFTDMSVSMNHYYDFNKYPDKKLPDSVVIGDILLSYKLGVPSIYYAKTKGAKDDTVETEKESEDRYATCSIGGGCVL
jgi:ribonucleoside-diphosphate reductase alpha chain